MAKKSLNIGHPTYFINRELGMLAFQERVFEEVVDKKNPLLERVKFLSIVGSNLDEFFMVRVGGLKMQNEAGVTKLSIDGKTPAEQLAAIRKKTYKLMLELRKYLREELLPELDKAGIHILRYDQLNEKQKEHMDQYFHEIVFPVLTPLAFDPGHPFPHISNLSLNLAVLIKDKDKEKHFARVKIPALLPRLVPIKRSSGGVRQDGTVPHNHYFVWLEQLITAHINTLFPGMKIVASYPFRVTRNADIAIQELEASDLLKTMAANIQKRRFGDVIKLSVSKKMPDNVLDILTKNLRVDRNDIYIFEDPLGLNSLMELHKIERFDLKDAAFMPRTPEALRATNEDSNIFSAIKQGDILLHHPYDSFAPIVDFLKTAARDPSVLAIKQTLYRVDKESPVVDTLLKAQRDYGKQVAVLVELKARFDEESNIEWARMLENEGVHVTYGILGLKTHSKVTLVVRKEGERIQRYIHLGTGNYNQTTAKLYEDIGMFTCDEGIGADATDLFNFLTGYAEQKDFRKLLVAPKALRQRFEEMIEREIEHQIAGRPAHLIFKTNALVDKPFIKKLYRASQAGVKIDLIVRGICSLRPGVEGLSENIRVISVVGRFLEHSRIFYFHNAGAEEIYLGSADLMPRNLNERVEVVFPVSAPQKIRYIRDQILNAYLSDNSKARLMQPDGTYKRLAPSNGDEAISVQAWLLNNHFEA
ncbi:MAG: polyphosphate kinase 1 [Anaerolineaceae bacterium 4572_5.1]|nr:MAG: polyphosphate kinase 1 [Anaerolineaceae bacterium 4572_5.1]